MYSKEIKEIKIEKKKHEAIEILCLIKIYLPLMNLDSQFHQIIHLVSKIEYARPVSFRQMYILEKYINKTKS
jgi:hypothetical protein